MANLRNQKSAPRLIKEEEKYQADSSKADENPYSIKKSRKDQIKTSINEE